jgi:hypothetical protein
VELRESYLVFFLPPYSLPPGQGPTSLPYHYVGE